MKRRMLRRMLMIFFAVAILLSADITTDNELYNTAGVPCSYNYTNTYSASIGCWGTGSCYNGRYVSVTYYQWWGCSYSIVNGQGSSTFDETILFLPTGYKFIFPSGITASATAYVYDLFDGVLTEGPYSGFDESDCNGTHYTSQPFSYSC